jgi:1,4-alpha-glucan branching enzyme
VVQADDFDWHDDSFTMPPWNELVIYELHVGTFNARQNEVQTQGEFQCVLY